MSESGSAYTWNQNAREFRLTPWYNDPVTDESGEAFYVRDDASGAFWSPAPLPARGGGAYRTSHGFGYSRFETVQAEISSTLTVFVSAERPLKFSVLRLRNESTGARTLSVFGYVEWVLGDQRARTAPHVSTSPDPEAQAIYAGNSFNDAFSRVVGLFAVAVDSAGSLSGATTPTGAGTVGATSTGSRVEFIGRNGSLRNPRALRQPRLARSFGTGIDPCAAWQVPLTLAPGEERELVFLLGAGADADEARRLVRDCASLQAAAAELAEVHALWRQLLQRVVVSTPDPACDLLVNGWLTYQVIACRLWARSGFYQSGGAFGFRDQLQDAISLLLVDPIPARDQILLCASRQFVEGDVQHWWHPPTGRGVRTHFSDDYLWLPWAVAQYVEVSGDAALLDETVPFLEGRALGPGEESYYDFADTSATSASVYEHCTRALMRGLRFGEHGLPLIGAGDWNDGMNRVGRLGRGESVWLGFFLVDALRRFAPLARLRGDEAMEQRCPTEADALAARIDGGGWDGEWYRRAYTDDGTPLGSATSDECQIDSLPQSWSVLAGVGSDERRRMAVEAAIDRLVHPRERVIQLFDPPFDTSDVDPGYIKGYIPGTRENGGQYTHAAIWLGMACAGLGRCDEAWRLFDIINPINHALDPADVRVYKVEPYVVAADVYWARGHRGRGGWTWYTGSAGWLYRFALQSLLGVHVRDGVLTIAPCVPGEWPGYRVAWQHGAAVYDIEVERGPVASGSVSLSIDGSPAGDAGVTLVDDGKRHAVRVIFSAG
ncbi:MAG: GH36-type glycosyl hydrolase domain-containing protein, partial [Gammaproteobacteria bacterium]